MLDVLMYLFENYIHEDVEQHTSPAQLEDELVRAGFAQQEVARAFVWLEGLSNLKGAPPSAATGQRATESFRIFSLDEQRSIGPGGQGLLLYLEQIGVLNSEAREAVIDRVMALESGQVDEEQLKWVILMVLFNQPGAESSYAWMEDFVYDGAPDQLH